jgi:N-formylglutamate amidohydrolase
MWPSDRASWEVRVLYFWHSVANTVKLLTLCSNDLTDLNLSDMRSVTRPSGGRYCKPEVTAGR